MAQSSGARCNVRSAALVSVFLILLGAPRPGSAIPAFARRYKMPCEQCHTMVPRLTRIGYSFYKSGYRFPRSVEEKLGRRSHFASVLADGHLMDEDGRITAILDTAELQQVGILSEHVTARLDYVYSPQSEENAGVKEAYVRLNSDALGTFWTLQVGQIPILTGFKLAGAREATITPSMWFGPVGPLTGAGQGNLALGDLELGAEIGYNAGGFNGRVSWFNGIEESGARASGLPGNRPDDWMLQVEYLLDRQGSSVAALHYQGGRQLPSTGFDHSFSRSGVFASWTREIREGMGLVPRFSLDLNGAYFWGHDRLLGGSAKCSSDSGSIVEVSLYDKHRSALIARFDSMKPSAELGTTSALTFAVAHRPSKLYRIELEYRKQMRPGAHSLIGSIWAFY